MENEECAGVEWRGVRGREEERNGESVIFAGRGFFPQESRVVMPAQAGMPD